MQGLLEKISSFNFVATAFAVLAAAICFVIFRKIQKHYLKRYGNKGQVATIIYIFTDIVRVVVLLLMILAILQSNGIDVSSAMAGFGIASAIVGLALQDYLKDVIMGIHILSDHSFEVGDVVDYNGYIGKVISFTLKATTLQNVLDSSTITVCNRNISEIIRRGDWYDLDVPLSYDDDVKTVHTVMKQICERIQSADGIKSCEYKGTQEFSDSSILYRVRFWCSPEQYGDARRTVIGIVQDGLKENGLSIPFNQLDVHMQNEEKQ